MAEISPDRYLPAHRQQGFTLVELAIVLVIVGLLIGGILAAQSMISTAKISATVRQIGQFDAMVMNFKSKFNYLPGDAPQFGGDGDEVVDITENSCGGCDDYTTVFTGEIANFWNNLSPSEYASSSTYVPPGGQISTNGAAKNVPVSKMGKSGSVFIASGITTDNYRADKTTMENYYAILGTSQYAPDYGWNTVFRPSTATNSAITPLDLLAIDKKLDDGIYNSGNVLAGAIGTQPGYVAGGIIKTPIASCVTGGAYKIDEKGYTCTPLFRIGAVAGDPQ